MHFTLVTTLTPPVAEPINIFQHIPRSDSELSIPIRLCYHRGVHYNSLVDPNNASLGVGLGLPGLKPGINDKNTVSEALKHSDNTLTEQKMIEDKIKATDWEATNEAIEEQVARDSYLQWLADQEKARGKGGRPAPAATVTSGQCGGGVSPRGGAGSFQHSPVPGNPTPPLTPNQNCISAPFASPVSDRGAGGSPGTSTQVTNTLLYHTGLLLSCILLNQGCNLICAGHQTKLHPCQRRAEVDLPCSRRNSSSAFPARTQLGGF